MNVLDIFDQVCIFGQNLACLNSTVMYPIRRLLNGCNVPSKILFKMRIDQLFGTTKHFNISHLLKLAAQYGMVIPSAI